MLLQNVKQIQVNRCLSRFMNEHTLISYMQIEYRTFSIVHFVSTHTINDKTQVKIALLHVCKAK